MAALLKSLSTDNGLENNLDLLQQLALQSFVNNGDKKFYNLVTNLRVGNECYQRLSGKRKIQQAKVECIKNITEFIKENPKASQDEIKNIVHQQIAMFAATVGK